ncbi:MAG: efflux transporter outer membrane subunit [Hyphomonadaceae bacterium]|nr:efflux transporter outer membrane subunit [Hyphomonadaceae bacterium]
MRGAAAIITGLSLSLAVNACAGKPRLPVAPRSFAAAQAMAAGAVTEAPAPYWLSDLGSVEISGFAVEALRSNPELKAAEGRAEAARHRARGARGGLLPTLTLGLTGERIETPVPGSQARTREEFMTSSVTSTWEPDVWGRLTARALASDLNADALEADLDAARLSTAGRAASDWVDLLAAQEQHALAREDLDTRVRALDLTQRRYERGLADALALRTARSQVASARAGEAQAADALLISARRLQETLGRYPDGALRAASELPTLAALNAAGAPNDLLERRPDVVAAEQRMRAAGFRVHEARAAMLPRLTLTASADGIGDRLTRIDDLDSMVTSLIAGLTAPIFRGGALRAERRAASAEQRTAAADYVGAALAAWREVEAAISADASLAIRERELASAAEEARAAQTLAEREYARGVATIFELIDAYTRRIDAERGLIDVRANRVSNRILYHVALGGGAETGGLSPAAIAAAPKHDAEEKAQ